MDTEKIVDYVMETPGNTNPNVLRSLLNNLDSGTNLPDNPTQDGTYALQNTVSSGTSTLFWASGGSSGGVLIVEVSQTENETGVTYTANKTAGEIIAAMPLVYESFSPRNGVVMYFPFSVNNDNVSMYEHNEEDGYCFGWLNHYEDFSHLTLLATTLSDYPTVTISDEPHV